MKQILLLGVMMIMLVSLASAEIPKLASLDISLINQEPDPVAPGSIVELQFKVENSGGANAEDVEFRLVEKYPFTVIDKEIQDLGSIQSRQTGDIGVIVKYRLKVDNSAPDGDHTVDVEYRYSGSSWIREEDFVVDVRTADPTLSIFAVNTQPERFEPGGTVKLVISLENEATSILRNIRVSLGLSQTPFLPLDSTSEKTLKQLKAGETAGVVFNLIANSDAESKVHETIVTLDYKDELGNTYSKNNTIGLIVEQEPEYVLGVEDRTVYTAKSKGEVVFSISNTGHSNLNFLTTTLQSTDDYTVISAPTIYVGNLESDDFETAEYDIFIDSSEDSIPLMLTLVYKDDFNREIVRNERVQLEVYSKGDAAKFGLTAGGGGLAQTFFSTAVVVIALVFIIFMLVDASKNKMPRYKKALWIVLILTGIGAALYYFMARRK